MLQGHIVEYDALYSAVPPLAVEQHARMSQFIGARSSTSEYTDTAWPSVDIAAAAVCRSSTRAAATTGAARLAARADQRRRRRLGLRHPPPGHRRRCRRSSAAASCYVRKWQHFPRRADIDRLLIAVGVPPALAPYLAGGQGTSAPPPPRGHFRRSLSDPTWPSQRRCVLVCVHFLLQAAAGGLLALFGGSA